MKKYFFITLLLVNLSEMSFAQIDQEHFFLSTHLKVNFPYGGGVVTEQNCDSLFTGVFYISFQINAKGKCFDIHFHGIKHSRLMSVFSTLLIQANTSFESSFTAKMYNKVLLQPVFYSFYSCSNDTSIKFEPTTNWKEEESQLYFKALVLLGKQNQKLSKSIEKGFPLPVSKGYIEGVMLSPCVIDYPPGSESKKTM